MAESWWQSDPQNLGAVPSSGLMGSEGQLGTVGTLGNMACWAVQHLLGGRGPGFPSEGQLLVRPFTPSHFPFLGRGEELRSTLDLYQ